MMTNTFDIVDFFCLLGVGLTLGIKYCLTFENVFFTMSLKMPVGGKTIGR